MPTKSRATLWGPLLMLAFLLAACQPYRRGYHVYGADLETQAECRAFIWSADPDAHTFRCVIEDPLTPFRAQEVISLGTDPGALDSIELAGATIVLSRESSEEAKRRAKELLATLEDAHPEISVHFVRTSVAWHDVVNREQLDARIQEAQKASEKLSGLDGRSTFWGELFQAMLPHYIVVPKASEPSTFLSTGDLRNDDGSPLLREPDPAQLWTVFEGDIASTLQRIREKSGEETPVWVVMILPADLPEDHRQSVDTLLLELIEATSIGIHLIIRRSDLAYWTFTDDAAFRTHFAELLLEGMGSSPWTPNEST